MMMRTGLVLIRGLAWLLLASAAGTAQAEGGRELSQYGGGRAWMETYTSGNHIGGVPRETFLEVYATPGQTISLGSSAFGLGSGNVTDANPRGRIRYWRPDTTQGECTPNNGASTVAANLVGRIQSRIQELAGPAPATNGYTPCNVVVAANQGGIWRVKFYGVTRETSSTSNLPPQRVANANWPSGSGTAAGQPASGAGASHVMAWDVTVRQGSTVIPGRVWADHLALNSSAYQNKVALEAYVLTRDGYLYKQRQDIGPFVYVFFANNRGILTGVGGEPSFKSKLMVGGSNGLDGQIQNGYLHGPHLLDTPQNITHKLFFNMPAGDLPEEADYARGGTDWIRRPTPLLPPIPENVEFVGVDGTPFQAGSLAGGSMGGKFKFTNPSSDEYLSIDITLKFSANGVNVDRTLNGLAPPGAGELLWDGLDGAGNPVIPSVTGYQLNAALLGGEVHFPFLDVEISDRLRIERLNGPFGSGPFRPGLLFWDHSEVPTSSSGTFSQALVNLTNGIDSTATSASAFTEAWGDAKALDMWAYMPSNVTVPNQMLQVSAADVRIVKTADFQPVGRGGVVAYTLTVDNLDAVTFARAVRVQDSFHADIENATWTCEITVPGLLPADKVSQCVTASGSGNIDARVDLRTGAQAVFKIRGTVRANAAASLSNTATASRGADAADPNMLNNTSTVVIATVPGYAVSGQVYEDLQPNNTRDAGENWNNGVPVWVTLVRDTGVVVESKQVLAGSGAYSFAGVPAGAYRLILGDANLSAAAVQPPGFQFTAPANGIRNVSVVAATVTGQDFGLFRVTLLQGAVFEDNGAGGGIAHNGIRDGAEAGLPGMVVQALSGATVLSSAVTTADGSYALLLPPGIGAVDIVAQTPAGFISISENVGSTAAVNPSLFDDRISFTPVTGTHYTGVNFGDVREPSLAPNQIRTGSPGAAVFLPHVFTAHTAGTVVFTVPPASTVPTPAIPGWDTMLFVDSNCNGSFDSGEPALGAAVAVNADAGAQVCLLLRVMVPLGAPANAQWQAVLQAVMSYTGAVFTSTRQVTDLVTVGEGESLILLKEVDRTVALPGETLTYVLRYRNPGPQPVSNVVIRDVTPAFTVYVAGSASCVGALPPTLASCVASVQPAANAAGAVEWTLNGVLQAGSEGRVQYRVKVEQ